MPWTPGQRQAAAATVFPVLTPPEDPSAKADGGEPGSGQARAEPAEVDTGVGGGSGFPVVSGHPRNGTRSLSAGALPRCDRCGVYVGGKHTLVEVAKGRSTAWCIGTLCDCEQPWYTQESVTFTDFEDAAAALAAGEWELP